MRLSLLSITTLLACLTAIPSRGAPGQAASRPGDGAASGGPQVARLRTAAAPSVGAETSLLSPWPDDRRLATTREARGKPSFWKHTGIGLLVGAAVGLGVGLAADSEGACGMMLCTYIALPGGAAVGTVTGAIVWAIRRTD